MQKTLKKLLCDLFIYLEVLVNYVGILNIILMVILKLWYPTSVLTAYASPTSFHP